MPELIYSYLVFISSMPFPALTKLIVFIYQFLPQIFPALNISPHLSVPYTKLWVSFSILLSFNLKPPQPLTPNTIQKQTLLTPKHTMSLPFPLTSMVCILVQLCYLSPAPLQWSPHHLPTSTLPFNPSTYVMHCQFSSQSEF